MALERGQEYYFLTAAEYNNLSILSNDNPDVDIFDTVFKAFKEDNFVVIDGATYYYAPKSSFPTLTPSDLDDLLLESITLDSQLFLSMAKLHPSAT